MELRKIVGPRPLLQCGASVIAEDAEGRILLQRRTDDGTWAYCGGSVELNERVEDAACREFREESGLTAVNLELFGVFSGPELHHVYPNGDEVSNIDIAFICREWTGELACDPEEVRELGFFPPTDLPRPIFKANRYVLSRYLTARNLPVPEYLKPDAP